jgi:hypothetical protein
MARTARADQLRRGEQPPGRVSALANFLESIPQTCPHDLFQREDGSRGSQLAPDFLALDKLIVVKKQNAATELAALILPAVGSNYERHPKLRRFMLANDSTTIAVEVPVWLTQDDIAALEKECGIRLLSGDPQATITGHIDFLQVRNGAVHILDYKPDARTNKPIAQLTVYALAPRDRRGSQRGCGLLERSCRQKGVTCPTSKIRDLTLFYA